MNLTYHRDVTSTRIHTVRDGARGPGGLLTAVCGALTSAPEVSPHRVTRVCAGCGRVVAALKARESKPPECP